MPSFCLAVALITVTHAEATKHAPVRIRVSPPSIELSGARDRQGMVVQAELADGSTRDVTAAAEMTFDKPVATVTNGFVAPAADGFATLTIKHAELAVAVTVTVKRAA